MLRFSFRISLGWFSTEIHPDKLLLAFATFLVLIPGVWAGAGEDFSNNLFSDLAPILALFGEQVAKQFLSHSTSWLDCLIFACNPISIITGATSAIRVGGSRWLKSMIGRAGEAEATAELELMSSTSSDVCELWNGVGIVRVVGSPAILELIYCSDDTDGSATLNQQSGTGFTEIYTLDEAKKARLLTMKSSRFKASGHASRPGTQNIEPLVEQIESQNRSPPNIFRNTSVATENSWELIVVAIIGVFLQAGVLVYDGVITYDPRWKKPKDSSPVAGYAFPLTFIGTLVVVMGMFLCALVIDVRTTEERWQATSHTSKKDFFQVVWLQRGQLVGDQAFGSFAIYAPPNQRVITTSRKTQGGLARLQLWSLWGSVAAIVGFVLQFVGLRNMHWSASIVQLGATGIMTILRIVIRRHLSALPIVHQLLEGFELDFMAKAITHCEDWRIHTTSGRGCTGDQDAFAEASAFSSRVLRTRVRLSQLTLWRTECSEVADQVTQTMQTLMNHLFEAEGEVSITTAASKSSEFVWTMPIVISRAFGEERGEMSLKLRRTSTENRWTPWEADRAELEALISLWMSHFRQRDFDSNLWILGPYNIFSASTYDWWIYRGASSIRIQNLRSVRETNQVNGNRILSLASGALPEIDVTTSRIFPDGEELLGVITKTSIQQMFGQYLFGVFLNRATDIIDSLEGKTDVMPGVGGGSYTLVNESVRKIAEIVQRYGLATVEDSYRLVISPLCHKNKLIDPFDDRDILRKIISIQHDSPETASDQHLIAYRRLIDFCTKKSTLLSGKDHWRAAREAFSQLSDVSREILGAHHPYTVEADKARKGFAAAFVNAKSSAVSISSCRTPDDPDGAFRLHSSAARGDLELAYKLLEEGSGVDTANAEGRTSLHLAIEHGHSNVCRLLIFYGANIDDATSIDDVGNNHGPRQDEISRVLLLNWGGASLLHKAAQKGYDLVLETLLAESGIDISAKDKSGWTPLHYASKHGHETTIKLLIDNEADIAAKCPDGQTALHLVTKNGHQAAIRLLVENRVSVNTYDQNGQTALHIAAISGLEAIVEELINGGADLTSADDNKRTALQLAVMNKHPTVVKQLIMHGADLAAKDKSGFTAVHAFCNSNAQDTETLEILLENGADIAAKDIWAGTPLSCAAESGNIPALKLLVAKGASMECRTDSGRTPLVSAALKGQVEAVKVLIEAGADVKTEDGFKRTPLHYAALSGYNPIAKLLLAKGLDINAADVDGWTPLHYASRNHHQAVIKILLDGGADVSIEDRKGRIASYYSARRTGSAYTWLRALGS